MSNMSEQQSDLSSSTKKAIEQRRRLLKYPTFLTKLNEAKNLPDAISQAHALQEIAIEYNLDPSISSSWLMQQELFENNFIESQASLCKVKDLQEDLFGEKYLLQGVAEDHGLALLIDPFTLEEYKHFPIAILLSPDMSIKDMKSFIDKNWDSIKKLQKRHRPKQHLRTAPSKMEDRDQYIFENRKMNTIEQVEELAHNVRKLFPLPEEKEPRYNQEYFKTVINRRRKLQ